MDLIRSLRELAFAARLRRLSDRLMRDASRLYAAEGYAFEARWFPVLYLLRTSPPLPVTQIARDLGITHPAVNQIAGAMIRRGLLEEGRDANDERKRLLSLSPQGRSLAADLAPLWEEIRAASEELLSGAGGNFLESLEAIESALETEGIDERVRRRRRQATAGIEIIDFEPRYRVDFRRLNEDWLLRDFEIEPADEAILADPEGEILARGGVVLLARLGGRVVGTCALIPEGRDSVELAKMAVAPQARRRGVGRRLALEAIDRARLLGAKRIVLLTSRRLVAANALYRSLGFSLVHDEESSESRYMRPSISMKLELSEAGGGTPIPRNRRKQ